MNKLFHYSSEKVKCLQSTQQRRIKALFGWKHFPGQHRDYVPAFPSKLNSRLHLSESNRILFTAFEEIRATVIKSEKRPLICHLRRLVPTQEQT